MHPLPARKSPAGFTLLELLVVITITGLLVALAPPLYSNAVPGAMLKTTTLEFALSLREARGQALSSSAGTDLKLIADPPSYAIEGTSAVPLPDGIYITAYDYFTTLPGSTVGKRILTDEEIVIHFYPDGSSSGAVFGVTNGDTSYRINVSWLTSRITISEAEHDDN